MSARNSTRSTGHSGRSRWAAASKFAWCALLWLANGCGDLQLGGGSDVPNELSGRVVDARSRPMPGAVVHLRPDTWIPGSTDSTWTALTDSVGTYSFPPRPADQRLVLTADVPTDSVGAWLVVQRSWLESGTLPDLRARPWGSLAGTVRSTDGGSFRDWKIVIPGLGRQADLDSLGRWRLDSLPPGTFAPVLLDGRSHPVLALDSCEVESRDTARLDTALATAPSATAAFRVLSETGTSVRILAVLWTDSGKALDTLISDDSGLCAKPSLASAAFLTLDDGLGGGAFLALDPVAGIPDTIRLTKQIAVQGELLPVVSSGGSWDLPSLRIRIEGTPWMLRPDDDGGWTSHPLPAGRWNISYLGRDTTPLATDSVDIDAASTPARILRAAADLPDSAARWTILRTANADGSVAASARVVIGSESAGSEGLAMSGRANGSGECAIAAFPDRRLRLEIRDSSGAQAASMPWNAGQDLPATARLLPRDGVLSLRIALPPEATTAWSAGGFDVLLLGTGRRLGPVAPDAPILFDTLPQGTYRIVLRHVGESRLLGQSWEVQASASAPSAALQVRSDAMEDADSWARAGTVELQVPELPSAPGPIPVRVVLDGMVDFSLGSGNGDDLRFFDSAGGSVPFWVQLWDAPTGRAEAWILADSLPSGGTLSWSWRQGNPAAAKAARHSPDSVFLARHWHAVFDPTTGASALSPLDPATGQPARLRPFLNPVPVASSPGPWGLTMELSPSKNLQTTLYDLIPKEDSCTAVGIWDLDSIPPQALLAGFYDGSEQVSLGSVADTSFPRAPRLFHASVLSESVNSETVSGPSGPRIAAHQPFGLALAWTPTSTTASFVDDATGTISGFSHAGSFAGPTLTFHIGGVQTRQGFQGRVGQLRIARGAWSRERLALERFNLQAIPAWIRIQRTR